MKALVTGATGFIGSALVRHLLRRGDQVRILARSASAAVPLRDLGAEVRLGDVGTPASLVGVTAGLDTVFHLASVMRGSAADFERVDVRGTERLLEEAQRAGVGRFVYAGTLAGYPPPDLGAVIDERTPLDDTGRLGNYALAKARCEKIVLAAGSGGGATEGVVVRLGLVCGVGANLFPPHVCKVIARNWVILFGDGRVPLPLTLIDNAVDALVRGATMPDVAGKAFNIVDDDILTQRDYLELLRKCRGGAPHVLRLPLSAYYAIGLLSEIGAAARGKEPETTRYRIRCRIAHVRWDCSNAKRVLQWRPRLPLREGLVHAFHAARRSHG